MKIIYLGKFVNTHGLKGEIRIISDFEYKDEVFKIGNSIYKLSKNTFRRLKNAFIKWSNIKIWEKSTF